MDGPSKTPHSEAKMKAIVVNNTVDRKCFLYRKST